MTGQTVGIRNPRILRGNETEYACFRYEKI